VASNSEKSSPSFLPLNIMYSVAKRSFMRMSLG
jgi:hypothetical protein